MNIKVEPYTIEIEKLNQVNSGEYNIAEMHFEFSNEYEGLTKEAIFSTCDNTVKTAILNDECIIPSEVLTEPGNVLLGVFAYDTEDDELVLRYSPTPKYFNVVQGSYKEGNDPELPSPTEWEHVLELINQAITETNNLNIAVEKTEHTTTITLTKKDGTTQTVQIDDGKSLEFNWQGTSLGIRQEGQSEYQYVNLQGPKGEPGAIKFEIVDTLPTENIKEDTIYLVPITPDTQGNNYAEYIYVNGQWELLGKIGVQIDLTNYVQFTDYATSSKGGVIKVNNGYGIAMDSGFLSGSTKTYANYTSGGNSLIVCKGTLENVITGKDLTTKAYVDGLVGDIQTLLDNLNTGGGVQ